MGAAQGLDARVGLQPGQQAVSCPSVGHSARNGCELFLETLEKIMTVVRSGSSFRVILHTKRLFFAMPNAGNRVVVQVAMRDLQTVRQCFSLDYERVVTSGEIRGGDALE